MSEGHGEKKSLEQERDERLTPEQIKKHEGSRERYEGKLRSGERGFDAEKAITLTDATSQDAILEGHFRDEIKRRGIQISEEDLSKIVKVLELKGSAPTGAYEVETIDSNVKAVKRDEYRWSQKRRHPSGVAEQLSDAETKEFLQRFPPELTGAFKVAQEKAKEDIQKRMEEITRVAAKKVVDEL